MPNPAEWRDLLVRQLDARWAVIQEFDKAYNGTLELSYATKKFYAVYGSLFRALANNWMQIVVDSSVERLHVQGFRFGKNQDADEDAWAIWQANNLDGQANMLHTEAVKLCEAYWLVQPNGDIPRITAEHPSQVIVACAPGDRRQRRAALKKWKGEDGFIYANVYLPDRYVKYRTNRAPAAVESVMSRPIQWETIEAGSNPLGVVPVVPAPNNPSMIHGGTSDLAGGPVSMQKAIDKLCADALVGSESTAFRQRLLLGVEQPRDSEGRPVPLDQMEKSVIASKVLMVPGADARVAEWGETNLSIIGDEIDRYVKHLSAQTRTPPHYVAGQIVNASGDALKAAETGLVSKVRDKMVPFGEAHEEAMRLAFLSIDKEDPRAQATDAETIWKDPESRSQAEVVDAVTKQVAIGLPFEVALEKMGYSPQEIDRILALKEAESFTALTQPQPDAPLATNPSTDSGLPTPPAVPR